MWKFNLNYVRLSDGHPLMVQVKDLLSMIKNKQLLSTPLVKYL